MQQDFQNGLPWASPWASPWAVQEEESLLSTLLARQAAVADKLESQALWAGRLGAHVRNTQ